MLAPPPHKGNARQASALSYQSSSFDSKIVRGAFRRAADIGVKKITKIGRLATGRVGRMGGWGLGTISRICCRRNFFARFQFGDRTRREVRRRQAEARPELTSVVIKTQTSDKDQGHMLAMRVKRGYLNMFLPKSLATSRNQRVRRMMLLMLESIT